MPPLNGRLSPNTIYVSLDSRPSPDEYHWGLLVTGEGGLPTLHDASNRDGPWAYRERPRDAESSMTLICLVKIGELPDLHQAKTAIAGGPAEGEASSRTGEAFTCRIWVKDVLVTLHGGGIIQWLSDVDLLEAPLKKLAKKQAESAERGNGATVVNDPMADS